MSRSADPFAKIRDATLAHRAKHHCGAWPYGNGPLLGVIAGAVDARRILELGCALGYTALSFAHGAPKAKIDTIERDTEHATLARANFAAAGCEKRITVHEGDFAKVLPTLKAGYDVAFFDGNTPVPALHQALHGLLRPGGVLVTANLNHGGTANAVQAALFDGKNLNDKTLHDKTLHDKTLHDKTWLSTLVDQDGETAISVKL